jgi:Sec7 domain
MTSQYSSPPKRPAPVPAPERNPASLQDAFRTSSPPRTPHNRRPRGIRPQTGPRVNTRSSRRETFLDDVTPVDGVRPLEGGGDEKDPHDLAFSPKHVTRASVVDNMLMALDQFSNPTSSTVASREPPNASLRYNSILGRRRGNTFSSDASSDNESRSDESIPAYSFQRSQRSNSYSNVHFSRTLHPVPSLYEEEESHTRLRVFDSQRAFASSDQRHIWQNKNGRRSGKSSGSSSVDLSQALSSSRSGPASHRRSQSFDYGSDRRGFPILEDDQNVSARTYNLADEMEAAPTPIVHAGPRRGHSPIRHNPTTTLVPIYDSASTGRKNSIKTSKGQPVRKGRAATTGTAGANGRDELRETHDNPENVPPVPSYALPHPQSPTLPSHKPSLVSSTDLPLQSKEKPGFFRRVFGSKNTSVTTVPVSDPEHGSSKDVITASPTEESFRSSAIPSKLHKPTLKDPSSTSTALPKEPQTLSKKSSAFFRRRKKSVCEQMHPPVPLSLQSAKIEAAEPSPVSSLRQVMDPYLAGPPLPPAKVEHRNESPQGFHTARTSLYQRNDASSGKHEKSQISSDQSEQASSNALILEPKSNPNLRVPSQDNLDRTFLADNSGTDEPSTISRQNTPSGSSDGKPRISPLATPAGSASEGLLPVRFPFTSTSSSRAGTPSTGSRTPHSPTSPTLPNFTTPNLVVGSKSARPANLRLQQEALNNSRRGSSSKDQGASPVGDSLPLSGSEASLYKSAPSTPLDSYHKADETTEPHSPSINITASPKTTHIPVNAEEEQEQALKIFENRDDNLNPGEVSAWLGDAGEARERVRMTYMKLFNWTNVDILSALRGLCARIALKGETQQVDRMLDAFSKRWCECNRNHGFKSSGEKVIILLSFASH